LETVDSLSEAILLLVVVVFAASAMPGAAWIHFGR
jgi:hypothetical protein